MLNFKDHVLKSFHFLESGYSFHCVDANELCVRYESDKVFVVVRFDNGRSFELDVEIGQRDILYNGKERLFNMGEVLRLKGVEKKEGYSFLQASGQSSLENAIDTLSGYLEKYGNDLLKGNRLTFKSLIDLRLREGEEYAIARDLRFIRHEAEKAWKKRDYRKFVSLYDPIKPYMTGSEKKKLEYAERKLI